MQKKDKSLRVKVPEKNHQWVACLLKQITDKYQAVIQFILELT
jgi:hypothetical protein